MHRIPAECMAVYLEIPRGVPQDPKVGSPKDLGLKDPDGFPKPAPDLPQNPPPSALPKFAPELFRRHLKYLTGSMIAKGQAPAGLESNLISITAQSYMKLHP